MALPSSGPLSLSDIQGEFGGSNPIGLSEYYGAAAGIPSSGEISIGDFYGASAAVAARGGTVTTSGGYKYHTFTATGIFTVTSGGAIEFLVVAGGGNDSAGGHWAVSQEVAVGDFPASVGGQRASSSFLGKTASPGISGGAGGASGAPSNYPKGADRVPGLSYFGQCYGGQGGSGGGGGSAYDSGGYNCVGGTGGAGYVWLNGSRYGAARGGTGHNAPDYPQGGTGTDGPNGAGWGSKGSTAQSGVVIVRYPI